MGALPYRAVIVDFDRTLLRTDKTISDRSRRALFAWQAAGARLFAATARPERAIAEYRRLLSFDGVAALNGARILTPGGCIERPLDPADADAVLAQLEGIEGAVLSVEAEGGIYANRDHPLWHPIVTPRLRDLPGRETIYKVLASCPGLSGEEIPVTLPPDVCSTVADGSLLQIMSRRASKWNGVLALLEAFGISPAEAVYFGDDNDDLESIRRCGCGVAVGNALAPVRAAADFVTLSNDEDGVAVFLENRFPGK